MKRKSLWANRCKRSCASTSRAIDYEQEADRVAEQVMRMADSDVNPSQRQSGAPCNGALPVTNCAST